MTRGLRYFQTSTLCSVVKGLTLIAVACALAPHATASDLTYTAIAVSCTNVNPPSPPTNASDPSTTVVFFNGADANGGGIQVGTNKVTDGCFALLEGLPLFTGTNTFATGTFNYQNLNAANTVCLNDNCNPSSSPNTLTITQISPVTIEIDSSSITQNFSLTITTSTTPEPSSIISLGGGLLGLVGIMLGRPRARRSDVISQV